ELPRLVMNEVYCEMTNDPADIAGPTAKKSYQIKFWVELFNPLSSKGGGGAVVAGLNDQGGYLKLTDDAKARLQIQAGQTRQPGEYEIYRITIGAQDAGPIATMRAPNNVR